MYSAVFINHGYRGYRGKNDGNGGAMIISHRAAQVIILQAASRKEKWRDLKHQIKAGKTHK